MLEAPPVVGKGRPFNALVMSQYLTSCWPSACCRDVVKASPWLTASNANLRMWTFPLQSSSEGTEVRHRRRRLVACWLIGSEDAHCNSLEFCDDVVIVYFESSTSRLRGIDNHYPRCAPAEELWPFTSVAAKARRASAAGSSRPAASARRLLLQRAALSATGWGRLVAPFMVRELYPVRCCAWGCLCARRGPFEPNGWLPHDTK